MCSIRGNILDQVIKRNTLQDENRIRICGEKNTISSVKRRSTTQEPQERWLRIGIRQRGDLRWLGFAWAGTHQPIEWLAEIAEYLVGDAHNNMFLAFVLTGWRPPSPACSLIALRAAMWLAMSHGT